jgi:glycosyltransferase involved in cell wall biosynthesis
MNDPMKGTPRILLQNNLYHPSVFGGAEKSVQILAEALVREGLRVSVITLGDADEPAGHDIGGVKVYRVRLRNLFSPFTRRKRSLPANALWTLLDAYNPFMAGPVGRILRNERFNLVHTNNLIGFSAVVWALARRQGLPVVHTLRDYYLLCRRSSMLRNDGRDCAGICPGCRLISRPRRTATRHVTAVIGNSRYILDRHLRAGCFRTAAVQSVIYNAFPPVPPAGRVPPDQAGQLRVGFLGSIAPHKGIEFLLEAVAPLGDRNVSLRVGGQGLADYEGELRRRYEGRGVEFMGRVEPAGFFSRIDVLVVPSLWQEPLPRVIFEAYAFGIPVVAAARGGIPEIVEDGRTGILFEPDKPATLSAIIRRLAEEPATVSAMGRQALSRVPGFSPDRLAAEYRAIYESILSSRSG